MELMDKDCSNCKHCIDKEIWTCEIEEPCMGHCYYEREESGEHAKGAEEEK